MTIQSKSCFLPHALVVDDSRLSRILAARMLARMGYQVSVAQDGLAGVSSVQLTSFEVILMDVQMPVMNGFECTRNIRHMEKMIQHRATIIGVSADASESDCMTSGMDAFLPKPLEMTKLESMLMRVCAGGLK